MVTIASVGMRKNLKIFVKQAGNQPDEDQESDAKLDAMCANNTHFEVLGAISMLLSTKKCLQ
jgi:hypothetical protein